MKLKFQSTKPPPPPRNLKRDHVLRIMVALGLIVLCFFLLATRFFYLQVIKHSEYSAQANNNRVSQIPTAPIRGEIIDANGVVLAHNYPAYSLEIIPNQLAGELSETIDALRQYVSITDGDLKRFQKFRTDYRSYERIPLKLKLSMTEAGQVAAQLYRFPGVEVNARTFRDYPYGELTAHIIGYIGRISDSDVKELEENKRIQNYRASTHIGKMALENYYESQLHGLPGYQEVEKDAQGRIVRTLKSVPSVTGHTLQLALDIRMQKEADRLMENRRGALVAINPQTGGILALVSKPSFNPSLFIDGIDTETWKSLNEDWQRPLINRATQGLYPPGSTFKPFMGMAALESGQITQTTVLPSPGAWSIPGSSHLFRDSVRRGHGSANLSRAIQVSSDTFFYRLGYDIGIDKTVPYLAQFGLGSPTGIDLNHEYQGILPSREWKAKRFAKSSEKVRSWQAADMVSFSIGQGYNAYTPLQMAHATATLANDGVVFRPHVVSKLLDHSNQQITLIDPKPVKTLPFDRSNFEYVKNAMASVLKSGGTAWRVGTNLHYTMGGKTGTAQVVQIKQGARYNASELAEQHRDHAWFIAFAPVENPQIAVAVILENGGWGATAAPIARSLFDFYLLTLNQLPKNQTPASAIQTAPVIISKPGNTIDSTALQTNLLPNNAAYAPPPLMNAFQTQQDTASVSQP
ncbi:penicillin-binding protein 2 [Stenoxybacter acetivorans]|uniref:penicillin-binding protein 2 n=1 Tax=Stenoxybacter acetivorans TaxID=422441 RepID=UPI00068EDA3B|nr:penicillin-binding protein 2 [Stenoxybacter acetivorans]